MRQLYRDQQGAVAVLFAILAALLIGVGMLAIDIPRMAVFNTDLQNAADAAALAGAWELDGTTGAQNRAISAAVNAFTNAQKFGSSASSSVTINSANISFYSALPTLDTDAMSSATAATGDSDSSYIEVSIPNQGINFMFASVLGGPASTQASIDAVAGADLKVCGIVPMFLCNPTEPTNNTSTTLKPDYASLTGRLLQLDEVLSAGNFGFLCPSGDTTSTTTCGASVLPQYFGSTQGSCLPRSGDLTTKPGRNTGPVESGTDVRFDDWDSTMLGLGTVSGVLDNPLYAPSPDVTQGASAGKTTGNGCFHGTKANIGYVPTAPSPANPPQAEGMPPDNCFYTGTCSFNGQTNIGDGNWDYKTYYETNHSNDGNTTSAYPPTNWPGGTAPTTPTRYETYRYELETTPPGSTTYPNSVVETGQTIIGGAKNASTTTENGGVPPPSGAKNECYSGTPPSDGISYLGANDGLNPDGSVKTSLLNDRRVLLLAMVDCNAQTVSGRTSITPADYAYAFMVNPYGTDPTGPNNGNHTMDFEVIGGIDAITYSKLVSNVVELYRR